MSVCHLDDFTADNVYEMRIIFGSQPNQTLRSGFFLPSIGENRESGHSDLERYHVKPSIFDGGLVHIKHLINPLDLLFSNRSRISKVELFRSFQKLLSSISEDKWPDSLR